MKNILLTFLLLLSLAASGAGVQWNNYPTTNTMGTTDTLLIGNGGTNATITRGGLSSAIGLTNQINTSSNTLYGTALTQINTTSNSLQSQIGAGGGIVLPPNALGVLTNNGSGATNWSTSFLGTWIGAGTLPRTAADSTWASATNYLSLTNRAANTMVLGQTPKTTGGTNGFGSPTISLTNLLMGDLEYHISTNAFTNVVVGYIGPLTNYDGFRFYIPVGTNLP